MSDKGILIETLFLFFSTIFWSALLGIIESRNVVWVLRNALRFFARFRFQRPKSSQDARFESGIDSIRTLVRRAMSVALDTDVVAEQKLVHEEYANCQYGANAADSPYAMLVHDLRKHFGHRTVVDSISFSVHKQECFGLLGKFSSFSSPFY